MCYISILNLQKAGNDDEGDMNSFNSSGNAGSFVKSGVKKDHVTGEIVGWQDFYNKVSQNNQLPHNSAVDEHTFGQINKEYSKSTAPSYIVEPT